MHSKKFYVKNLNFKYFTGIKFSSGLPDTSIRKFQLFVKFAVSLPPSYCALVDFIVY